MLTVSNIIHSNELVINEFYCIIKIIVNFELPFYF